MSDPRRIVAYSDLLGFSELAVTNPVGAEQLLSDFYNFAQNIKVENSYVDLELFLFSDFLFAQGDQVEQVVNYMCHLYRCALQYSEHSNSPMLIRGGIARGGVITQQRREAPQVTKNFIVSPALTHAVKMESLVKGQRLLISAKEREEVNHFWNNNVHAICYDQPSLKPTKLFKAYRYQDILWARNLALDNSTSRSETMQHVRIAAQLFRKYYQENKSLIDHYAETLRICLLSYSGLLEPCAEDRAFVQSLIDETLLPYPDSSVWLGFLECVLLSKDAFAFHVEPAITNFLRVAILSKEWGEISKALEQKGHRKLLAAVKVFIQVAIPYIH